MGHRLGILSSTSKTIIAMVIVVVASGISIAASDNKKKPAPPQTRQTQVIRPQIYKGMEVAQKAYEAKDYAAAITALDALKEKQDKLNDYERATLYNLYAATYYMQGNNAKAIESYLQILQQPNLAEGLRNSSLYSLAQLYFLAEDYPKSILVIKKWLSATTEPSAEANALLAQAYYQDQQFAEAEKALVASIKISKASNQTPKEGALALLRAIYFERKQYKKAARVLEILVTSYPDKSNYWQQLAGIYGLLDRQADQTRILHVAHRANLLDKENDLLNVARLYLISDAPYPAVRVLTDGFKSKAIKVNVDNLQLFAQSLAMAREYKQQATVLKKLAGMSGESKHYVYLGQAYNELGEWDDAAAAFRAALTAKNVDKVADVQMQLGTALFNANKFKEAHLAFVQASKSEALRTVAGNWIKFVDTEIQRREALHN